MIKKPPVLKVVEPSRYTTNVQSLLNRLDETHRLIDASIKPSEKYVLQLQLDFLHSQLKHFYDQEKFFSAP
jgi:hypothetical protein